MKILVYSSYGFDKQFLEKATHGNLELVYSEQTLSEKTVHLTKGFDAVSLFTSDDANKLVLHALYTNGVRYIALRSVGYDHIDLRKARSLGIKVANVPEYSPYSVAEHAVTILLSMNRKLILGQKLMELGDYRLDHLIGFDLHGKTVGIVGTGKIGSVFAKIMHGFGCTLLAHDPIKNKELIQQTNVSYTSLENVCKNSDILSIHCPLNKTTKHMFNKTLFSKMKKGVFFINTARGGIVNTEDLIEMLDNKTIAAAGLDVYEKEIPIFFHDHINNKINDPLFLKLCSYPNVMVTGHQGFLTQEALREIATATIANLNAWAYNGISENELNK